MSVIGTPSARVVWRILMLPLYTLLAGAAFSGAFAGTRDSMLAFLAGLTAWPMIVAGVAAAVMLLAGVVRLLRLRARRLRDARHGLAPEGIQADPG